MQRMTSAFLMSTQPLVIAPRPKVAARLATVGACQTRACVSRYTTPQEAPAFHCRKLRSEERRVGKECRSGWAADHYRKIGLRGTSVGGPRRVRTVLDWV